MRAVWKGAISFGLVSIPVKLYRATETKDVSFHQVRASDGSRIRYQRLAVADGEEVTYAEIAKGFELPSGETVVLTDDDLADLPLTTNRTIEVDTFVPLEQVDPIYFDKTYYVEPDGKQALKPYALLRDALGDSGRVAVVKVALRQREQVATLRVREGLFVLETMVWPDEVRAPDFAFLDEKVELRDQELSMARSLIDSLAGDFDPMSYSDAYREALEQVVAAKVEGRDVVAPVDSGAAKGGDVVDLMSALRASVDAAKKSRADRAAAAESGAESDPTGGASDDAATDTDMSERDESPTPARGRGPAKKAAPKKSTKKAPSASAKAKEGSDTAGRGTRVRKTA